MGPIRIVVADDHRIVREGLVSLLSANGECEVVGEASNGTEAVELAQRLHPNVMLIDLSMPGLNGMEVVRRIAALDRNIRLLVLTMHEEEEYVLHLVKAGAHGFMLKDNASEQLIEAVKSLHARRGFFDSHAAKVMADQYRRPADQVEDPYGALTPREREVFHLIIEGLTTKEIARQLDISTKTAENHRAHIIDKLDCKNTVELVRFAARRGLLD